MGQADLTPKPSNGTTAPGHSTAAYFVGRQCLLDIRHTRCVYYYILGVYTTACCVCILLHTGCVNYCVDIHPYCTRHILTRQTIKEFCAADYGRMGRAYVEHESFTCFTLFKHNTYITKPIMCTTCAYHPELNTKFTPSRAHQTINMEMQCEFLLLIHCELPHI